MKEERVMPRTHLRDHFHAFYFAGSPVPNLPPLINTFAHFVDRSIFALHYCICAAGGTHPTDVRMTTRFKEDDITEGLTGAIHETGHSLYEQGRNLGEEFHDQPVSAALSMGVHESQSLLWERMVALSRPFQSYLLPKLKENH